MVFVNLFTLSRWWCANQNSDSVSCVPVRFHLLCWRLFLWFIPIGYCFIYEYLWINCNNIIIEDPSHSIAESCSCQYENASQFYYMLSILYSLFYSLFLFVSSELKSNCFILFRCCWLLLKFYFDSVLYTKISWCRWINCSMFKRAIQFRTEQKTESVNKIVDLGILILGSKMRLFCWKTKMKW